MKQEELFVDYRDWMVDQWSRKYYQITNACCSIDGEYIIASDCNGYIALFSLKKYLAGSYWLGTSKVSSPSSECHFKGNYESIHSLEVSGDFILSLVIEYIQIYSLLISLLALLKEKYVFGTGII